MKTKSTEKQGFFEKLRTANLIAGLFVIFCGGYLLLLVFVEIPDKNRDLVNFLGGSFFSTLAGITYYYFNYKKDEPEPFTRQHYQDNFCNNPRCPLNEIDPTLESRDARS